MKRLWAYLVLFGITEIILSCTIAQAAPITISNPFPLSQTVDRLQQVSITVSSVAGGKSPYTYQWLDTVPGSATFSSATICVNPHSLTCFFNTSESTVTGNYRFKLQVTDKKGAVANSLAANVIINTKLMAGSVTPPAAGILQGDSITLQANPSGGTPPYVYQWYSVKNTSPCATAGIIISGAVLPTYNAAPTNSIYYCYRIADSATTPVYNYSGTVLVTVTPRISTTTVSTVSTTSAVTSTTTETSTTTVSTRSKE